MQALITLLTTSIAPEVATLLANQLAAGSPLDTAVHTVLGQLEAAIPNATLRAVATDVLSSLVTVVEKFGASALAPPAPAASASSGS